MRRRVALGWLGFLSCGQRDTAAVPLIHGLEVRDVAPEVGSQTAVAGTVFHGRCCLAADFDLDGRNDLWVGNPGDDSYVLLADEDFHFSPAYFLEGQVIAWAGSAVDYDNDGDRDIYVSAGGNEMLDYSHLLENTTVDAGTKGPFGMRDVTDAAGIAGTVDPVTGARFPIRAAGGTWSDVDLDGDVDLYVSVNTVASGPEGVPEEGRDLLYRNDGAGVFTEIAKDVGLDALERRPTRHSAFFDADNDGDMDLFENNYMETNTFWRNRLKEDGALSFEDATEAWGLPGERLEYPWDSYAGAAVDFNNDGWTDLIVFAKGSDPGKDTPYPPGHALFMNTGGLGRVGFVNVAEEAGLNTELDLEYGVMGCQASDVNVDGYPDVYIGNGAPTGTFTDAFHLSEGTFQVEVAGLGSLSVPKYVSGTHLIDFPADMPPDLVYAHPYPYHTHGICSADFDGDGYYEMFVTNGGPAFSEHAEPDRLFDVLHGMVRPALRVAVLGDGVAVNRDAIGAAVTVTFVDATGQTRRTRGLIQAGTSFSAQNDHTLTLALPGVRAVVSLSVVWPDGEVTTLPGPLPTLPTEIVTVVRP